MSEPIPTDPIIDPDFPPEDPVPPEPEPVDPGEEQPVVDGWTDAPVSGDRVNVFDAPIVAGDPDGARIEIRSTGFHAFNGVGAETAHIDGAEGVFVGGEFRTSDALPGQVTLSDTAAQGMPGLSIEPGDSTGYDVLPSIGPDGADMHVNGGVATDGSLAGALFGPAGVSLYQNGPGENGTGAWVDVAGMQADLGVRPDRTDPMYESGIRAREQSVTAFSQSIDGLGEMNASPYGASVIYKDPAEQTSARTAQVKADASGAELFFRPPGGAGDTSRYLTVDANGVWVKTNKSGSWKQYNLEETAQDSGWQSLTLASGLSGGWSPAWRNKGGVIYMRGRVTKTGDWTAGWNVLATDVGADARPASHIQRAGATRGAGATFLEVTTAGVLQVWFDETAPGTTTVELSPMFYPLG